MKFKVYAHYLYIYTDLLNPSPLMMTFHVTAIFPAPYLCHVIDNQPVKSIAFGVFPLAYWHIVKLKNYFPWL